MDITDLESERDKAMGLFKSLVVKLDRICSSDERSGVFGIAAIHNCPYTGEDFKFELDEARAFLARMEVK